MTASSFSHQNNKKENLWKVFMGDSEQSENCSLGDEDTTLI